MSTIFPTITTINKDVKEQEQLYVQFERLYSTCPALSFLYDFYLTLTKYCEYSIGATITVSG